MTTHSPELTAKATAPLQQQEQRIGDVVATSQQGPAGGSTAAPKVETAAPPDTDGSSSLPEPEGMDTFSGPNLPAGKRPHDRILTQATQQEGSGGDEPPPKAPDHLVEGRHPGPIEANVRGTVTFRSRQHRRARAIVAVTTRKRRSDRSIVLFYIRDECSAKMASITRVTRAIRFGLPSGGESCRSTVEA
ncbi:hypothetical protein HPB50_025337 [Hyalomma asiaticum]|uniref:Uncharacterized protein n=1 Tax=Hyalomma asiaticum TaxID=266040 RepID=A0ACB7STD3_HYAAI|nr:hypothetical protein HPB50_025337 [Hyalomma asiaticum]